MRKCLDEGILQSYFDGELSSERMESVTTHLASCLNCSAVARELESENNLVATALAAAFDLSVPTERLRERIDAAVAGLQAVTAEPETSSGLRSWFQALSDLFSFSPQRVFGYAALVVVLAFATIFAVIHWRQAPSVLPDYSAATEPKGGPNASTVAIATASPEDKATPITNPAPYKATTGKRNRPVKSQLTPDNQGVARVKLMPGERSYLKTIAALDSTIKSKGSRPMRPALQAEYERNLALVDRALAATRTAAKNNPNDPDATEFMFAAYQSKVDLLNTVADARLYNREH
jgi:anti-sigma factor RsiW